MNYGCIGEHLSHSFSKEIHAHVSDYEYEIREIAPEDLENFMKTADFSAINVTIPYKEAVLPYLYSIDDSAKKIGSVNTVINRGGVLYGYNTDFYGMTSLIKYAGIDLSGKKVAILGTGGTSKTAFAVAEHLGASEIVTVSRKITPKTVSYEELYNKHSDTEIIINTTPVGMYPNIFDSPIEPAAFKKLCGVIDAVYNPLSTSLILKARELYIPAMGGLYMLVAQAVRASELFLDVSYPVHTVERIFKKTMADKKNIVLVGMPSSGKTTVGKILSEELGRTFFDTDAIIEEKTGKTISDIFNTLGEDGFREIESEVIKELSSVTGAVISTGGGAVLREKNVFALKKNGRIYFIDRPLDKLLPTSDRPLANSREQIEKRFKERYGIYEGVCDAKIPADTEASQVAKKIEKDFFR